MTREKTNDDPVPVVDGSGWDGPHLYISYTDYFKGAYLAYKKRLRLPTDVPTFEDTVPLEQRSVPCAFDAPVPPLGYCEVLFQDEEEYNG